MGAAEAGRDMGHAGRVHQQTPASFLLLTEDDSNSYENVLICKPSAAPDSGKAVSPKKGWAGAGSPS